MLKATLFNPLVHDFSIKYDVSGKGEPCEFTIHALESNEFDLPVARNMLEHLAHGVLHERGIKTNAFDDLAKIREEIIISWPEEETLKVV